MEGAYYFGQGRLIDVNAYNKYEESAKDKNDMNNDDSNNSKKENKDNYKYNSNNNWKSLFNGYRFQIFSPSILRYK